MRLVFFFLVLMPVASLADQAAHPGNVFVAGESVTISPPSGVGECRVTDYNGNAIDATVGRGEIHLGKLPIGYYEVHPAKGDRITLGVIAPLHAPTPPTSPISIDVAMAWFYKTEAQQRAAAKLCTLAGVNWVRDRLSWTEMEPTRGHFADHNIYDDTAAIQ